jgi:hypothetical protein
LPEQNKVVGGPIPGEKSILSAVPEALQGAGAGLINTLTIGGKLLPESQQGLRKPPDTWAGKLGYGAEQGAEFFAPIPGAGKLKLMKGAAGRIARIGAEAGKSGVIGGAQTGSAKGAAESAALGAAGGALAEGFSAVKGKVAKSLYETELRPGKKPTLTQRGEMVDRGLKPGAELPIEAKSIPKLETEIGKNKSTIDYVTKDPASPFSFRSVPVKDLLAPVDDYIKRVTRVDSALAKTLAKKRADWAKALGGGTDATVNDAQRLKEDLYAVINSSAYAEAAEPGVVTAGRKLAARGMKKGIEKVIPDMPVREINHVIETDLRLKDAITSAVKSHPSWINDWAVFVLGSGAGELLGGAGGVGGHAVGGAIAIGALARMVARNPKAMSRLAIALQRSGVPSGQLLPAAQAAIR